MSTTTTTTPEVLWAQRSSQDEAEKCVVYLTINAPDVFKPDVELTSDKLHFQGKDNEGKEYKLDIDFFEPIDPEESKQHTTDRSTHLVLRKKETKQEYWPRLTKEKARVHWLKTDFDKWVDEDEQDAAEENPMAGMDMMGGGAGGIDFSKLGAMGGMGGMEGMPGMGDMAGMGGEGGDSDDEDDETPGLEGKPEGESST